MNGPVPSASTRIRQLFSPPVAGLWVLAISGLLGFRVASVGFADWQVVVETAQVVAGLVRYPPDNVFYIYHLKVWTVMHHLCALLLSAGVSEIQLSVLVSGLLGLVSFAAVSMIVYAVSRDALLSVGAGFVVLVARVPDFGAVYPLVLMGTNHTYGILGLSTVVLTVGLLAAGHHRAGLFLLAVAPSVHPALGGWLIIIVAACLAWDFHHLRTEWRPALTYFIAGCAVTASSLLYQLWMAQGIPDVDAATARRYLAQFIRVWDGHRRPADLDSVAVRMNVAALAAALTWLYGFADDVPRRAWFLLRVVAVAAVLSLLLTLVTHLPPERVPLTLLVLMPGRLVNLNLMIALPLLLGLIAAYRTHGWSQPLLFLLVACLLVGNRSSFWEWLQGVPGSPWPLGTLQVVETAWVVLLICVLLARRVNMTAARGPTRWISLGARAGTVAVMAVFAAVAWSFEAPRRSIFVDRTNEVFYESLSKGTGQLITAGDFYLVQLRTRRPVLLNGGALDGLTYSVEAVLQTERVLRDVYAIDFFDPPAEARNTGIMPTAANKKAWEQFSIDRWREIGRTYQAWDVLTPDEWALALPIVDQSRRLNLRLYRIPD